MDTVSTSKQLTKKGGTYLIDFNYMAKNLKIVQDFKNFLEDSVDTSQIKRIDINSLFDDDITLLVMNEKGAIGGHYTVFSKEMSVVDYDISELMILLDWCFQMGWSVTISIHKYYDIHLKTLKNNFEITKNNGDGKKG